MLATIIAQKAFNRNCADVMQRRNTHLPGALTVHVIQNDVLRARQGLVVVMHRSIDIK